MAAAAYENYEVAGKQIGRNPTTVRRQVEALEAWLHRVLVTDDVPLIVTSDGEAFIFTAEVVLSLIDKANLRADIRRTRVLADGTVTIDGVKFETPATLEIGRAMVASRAKVDPNHVPLPRVSGMDVDMTFYTRDS